MSLIFSIVLTDPWDQLSYRQTIAETYPTFSTVFFSVGNALFGGIARDPEALDDIYYYDPVQKVAVCTDALITNRQELLAQLDIPDSPALNSAKLLYHAYQKWGQDFMTHLDGDFSVVIWDETKNQVLACRDRMGVRPLYYHHSETGIAHTTYHALLLPLLPKIEYDPVYRRNMIARGLTWGAPFYEGTAYQGIKMIKHAHKQVYSALSLTQDLYWDLAVNPLATVTSLKEAREQFSTLLKEAVKKYMAPHEKISLEVSGGIDSGGVACLARYSFQDKPMIALSNQGSSRKRTDSPLKDEFPYAKALCEKLNIPIKGVVEEDYVDENDSLAIIKWLKGAVTHNFPIYHYPFYTNAKAFGAKVIFSGHGGDEYVSSQAGSLLPELKKEGRWARFLFERIWGLRIENCRTVILRWIKGKKRHGKENRFEGKKDLLKASFPEEWVTHIYTNQFDLSLQSTAKLRELFYYNGNGAQGMQGRLETSYLVAQLYGLHYIYPLLDWKLVQYYHHLPVNYKRRNGRGRYLFCQALAPFFPKHHLKLNTKRLGTPPSGKALPQVVPTRRDDGTWPESLKVYLKLSESQQKTLDLSLS